jgi:predicted amidophosphoribosyltransferase
VAAGLAALLAETHRSTLTAWAVDLVVPVPMHWLRRSLRGTSTADEIATRLAGELGLPCRRVLRRARATPMQNALPWEDRHSNVHGAFVGRGEMRGRRVLLVDDVTTTGSTLAACREAALQRGAAAVYAAVVARADRAAIPP